MADVQPFRLHEEPVKADDLNPGIFRGSPDFSSFPGRDLPDRIGQGEGGDFHTPVTKPDGVFKNLRNGPALEKLVADRKFYPSLSSHFFSICASFSLWPPLK